MASATLGHLISGATLTICRKQRLSDKSEFSGMITIRKYRVQDIVPAMEIWNEVVRDGIAFPQDEELAGQTVTEYKKR
jgi:hypothetical protein